MAPEEKTKCKACGREVVQVSGGHRQREYCDDACKHVALRRRKEDKRKEEIRQRWAGFTAETQTYLDWLMSRYGEDHAQGVATTIKRELGQAQRSPIEEQNIRHMEQYAIDCSLDAGQARERIATLEVELADVSQGREEVQARFVEYVRSTNEKLSELTGELAMLRQEQERKAQPEDQQNSDSYREKLAQAGTRIEKLERQVDVQRQKLGQYHQRFYPSSLAVAAQRLMALGAALNYTFLLKYDSQAVGIKSGEDAWREFATHASYEDVAQALLQAQHFFDNLQALGMLGKRDAPGSHE